MDEWFAIIADKDIYYPDDHPTMAGRLEYKKGEVVSYGSVIAPDEHLVTKGLRKVSIGVREREPDFDNQKWDHTTETIRDKTPEEKANEQGGN